MSARVEYLEARSLYNRALLGREKHLGPDHPRTLRAVHGLARLCLKENKYTEAETFGLRALSGRKARLCNNHPETLRSLHDLGLACEHQGRYEDAELYYRDAIAGSKNQPSISEPENQEMAQNLRRVVSKRNRGGVSPPAMKQPDV